MPTISTIDIIFELQITCNITHEYSHVNHVYFSLILKEKNHFDPQNLEAFHDTANLWWLLYFNSTKHGGFKH